MREIPDLFVVHCCEFCCISAGYSNRYSLEKRLDSRSFKSCNLGNPNFKNIGKLVSHHQFYGLNSIKALESNSKPLVFCIQVDKERNH